MDYYGLLFLYYLKGLSGKSVLRLFFNIEAGGTEQLLPENTSTPTTSPLLADIQYPDGLRTDQYFAYRETPTTVSNKARIKTIKGNTIKWNQLFNTISTSTADGIKTEYNSTTHLISITNNSRTSNYSNGSTRGNFNFSFIEGHKYFIRSNIDVLGVVVVTDGISRTLNSIFTAVADYSTPSLRVTNQYDFVVTHPIGDVTSFYFNVFDLTQMGLDSLTDAEIYQWFADYYPLPYYQYDSGSLLPFRGEGLKTVGFNQWDEEWEVGNIDSNTGANASSSTLIRSKNYISVFPNTLYYCHVGSSPGATFNIRARFYDAEKNYIGSGGIWWYNRTYTIPDNARYLRFVMQTDYGTTYKNDICINISDAERNGTYEPYTSSTLSLPIQQYFPTGMKSAENVYDEWTPSKATTRVGLITLNGSEAWAKASTTNPNGNCFELNGYSVPFKGWGSGGRDSAVSNLFEKASADGNQETEANNTFWWNNARTGIRVINSASTADEFKAKLQSTPLQIQGELATPTETPITTEDANEALSLLMGKSVSSNNANQLINIITKGE